MLEKATSFSSFSVNDINTAQEFYEKVLGLKVKKHEAMGLEVFTAGTSGIFVYPKKDHKPATFTVLNFIVEDLDNEVYELTKKGVKFEQYDMEYIKTNEKGIAEQGEDRKMAWFKDPAGNIFGLMWDKNMTKQ